jgi:hypothetical protein
MRLALPLLLLAGCAVLPISPRRMGTLEERVATLEKRLDTVEQAHPAFSLGEEPHSAPVASVGMAVPYEAATKTLLAARNSSGTYSLVSGNPVVTGTTITSTWANNTLADIATELTDSLSRSGKGAMLAPLKGYVGSVSAPGYQLGSDTTSGLYQISSQRIGMAVNGTKAQEWNYGGASTNWVSFQQGVTFTQALTDLNAITATGNGAGAGINATGGATGNGGTFNAGGTSGHGVSVTGKGAGVGVLAVGGDANGAGGNLTGGATNGNGVIATGTGSGNGVEATAGATGNALHGTSGATSGPALKLDAGNTVTPIMRIGTTAAPSGAALVGDMYMTTAGVLKVCVTAGTPCASFVSVGSQP